MNNRVADATQEIESGERFAFGSNWSSFIRLLNEERIADAVRSLQEMLDGFDLEGKRFLDAGSGSGLSSLAARRLGADVVSFDYDPASVAATAELKRRFAATDERWSVQQGSVLDEIFLRSLGKFDVVYSWGVLHHTGAMWNALENAGDMVTPGGLLFIAIYNDQGVPSRIWHSVKQAYNRAPGPLRWPILAAATAFLWGPATVRDLVVLKPFQTWRNYKNVRGMSAWHDVVDWVGGYPFEVATPARIIEFLRARSFELVHLLPRSGIGCNELVFRKH